MSVIRFQFQPEKVAQALAFFAKAGLPELSKLKMAKLLYYADKYHLLKYGRPVTGDVYYCLEHGPVPSASLNLMNDAISPTIFNGRRIGYDVVGQYLMVNTDKKNPEFTINGDPVLDLLSGSDVEALDDTISRYGQYSPWDLRNLTHRDATWIIPDGQREPGCRADIPYELFFEGQSSEVREMLLLVEEEQEQAKFADFLAR